MRQCKHLVAHDAIAETFRLHILVNLLPIHTPRAEIHLPPLADGDWGIEVEIKSATSKTISEGADVCRHTVFHDGIYLRIESVVAPRVFCAKHVFASQGVGHSQLVGIVRTNIRVAL